MASNVATPVAMGGAAGVDGYPPHSFGSAYIPGPQEGGSEDESGSEEDGGSEEDSGSDEEDDSEGEEEEEGEFEDEGEGWWDEDGTYHGEVEGEYNLAGKDGYGGGDEDRMLWTCGICNVAVNIFARHDHITSRPHIRAAKKQAGEAAAPIPSEPAYVPMWQCTLCDEDMSVFLREEHILGKEHLRKVRKQWNQDGVPLIAPDEHHMPDQLENGGHPYVSDETIESSTTFPDIPDPCFSSYEYTFSETFYCIICAAEFDLSMEEFHLDDVEPWNCTLCSKSMHPVSKEIHLKSERHTMLVSIQEAELADFHCEVCRRFYSPFDKEEHLAGVDHQQMVARIELEQRSMKRLEELRRNEGSSRPPPAPALPSAADKGKAVQTGQDNNRRHDPWVCRLCKAPLLGLTIEGHLRTFCPASKSSAASTGTRIQQPSNTNRLPYNPNVYFCDICKRNVGLAGKEAHLTSKKHRRAAKIARKRAKAIRAQAAAGSTAGAGQKPKTPKKKKPPKQYCAVCKKHKRGMADHLKSEKHLKKLAAQQQRAPPPPPPPPPPAQPQPLPPALSQSAQRTLPQAAPPVLSHSALQFLPPQVAMSAVPQPTTPAVPQPSPATPASWNPAHIRIFGDKFHCVLCDRHRFLVGINSHLKSYIHKKKLRELRQ